MSTRTISNLIFLLAITVSFEAFAAKVIQAKNGKVLIDLEGDTAVPNQNAVLINAENKKVAIVQLSQIKNGKAIGSVIKGQAQGNERVTLITPKATSGASSAETSNEVYRTNSKKMGVVLSLMSNAMTTKQTSGSATEDVAMKGTTFGVTGTVDWPMTPALVLRGTLGYEPFKASGTASSNKCDDTKSKDCSADITYLSTGGYLRYDFNHSKTQFWGAVGGTLKFPISKTTTALKQDDIKMTMTYGLAGGLDFFLSNKTFLPFSIEQQFFLKSDTVTASILMIRFGYGMAF